MNRRRRKLRRWQLAQAIRHFKPWEHWPWKPFCPTTHFWQTHLPRLYHIARRRRGNGSVRSRRRWIGQPVPFWPSTYNPADLFRRERDEAEYFRKHFMLEPVQSDRIVADEPGTADFQARTSWP